jgi:hypothetical protein
MHNLNFWVQATLIEGLLFWKTLQLPSSGWMSMGGLGSPYKNLAVWIEWEMSDVIRWVEEWGVVQ